MPSAAILRASAWCAAASNGAALGRLRGLEDDAQDAAHRFVEHGLVQLAAAHGLHHGLRRAAACGPGISRSSPPCSAATRSCTAPQSETTKPSKPHSSLRMSVSSSWCSEP